MAAVAEAHRLARLRDTHPAWSMLRAENSAVMLALLAQHFDRATRRLPAPELFARLDADLLDLRAEGFDLPRTGQAYCADWVRAGYLLRRPAEGTREETLEPTEGAFAALNFARGLGGASRAVTESRLTTLSTQLQSLARDSDPASESRLATLQAERAELDRQIAAVESGDFPVLPAERAVERSQEILTLAAEVPGDFARVRAELEDLNRELRARILDDDGPHGHTLDDVFRGVDLIGNSDAGRSFSAFYATILDPERSSQIDDWIETVLHRPFAERLSGDQRTRLRNLLLDMEVASSEVHSTMTSLSRSLRHFVQSRHFEDQRRLQRLLRRTQQQGIEVAKRVQPFTPLGLELTRIGMTIESVAALRLHNPSDNLVTEPVATHESGTVDLEALRKLVRESEIDMAELTENVADTLRRLGRATVASVLAEHPATQGLASVVGLLVLANDHGARADGVETVAWTSTSGTDRAATIPRLAFTPTFDAEDRR